MVLNELEYVIVDEKVKITNCINKDIVHIEIPDTIEGYPVVLIGAEAFSFCKELRRVVLPDNLLEISSSVFQGCIKLQRITLPNSVQYVYHCAFYDCSSLKTVRLSDNLLEIGICAFYNCKSLRSIIIPDSVKCIKDDAFKNCNWMNKVIFKSIEAPIVAPNTLVNLKKCTVYIPKNATGYDKGYWKYLKIKKLRD